MWQRPPKTGKMVNCKCCDKEFYCRKSLVEKGFGKFCSRKCEAKSRPNGPVERTCLQCGVLFKKDHWSVNVLGNGGRFCTRACTDKFKRKLRKRGEQEMFTQWQKREWIEDKCAQCKSTEKLELDHLIPRFAGGKATKENSQTLCRTCNRKKFWTDDYPLYSSLLMLRAENY